MKKIKKIEKCFHKLIDSLVFNIEKPVGDDNFSNKRAHEIYNKIIEIADILDYTFSHVDETRRINRDNIEKILMEIEDETP